MIRKLTSGKYRLYSRKKTRKPDGGAISAPLTPAPPPNGTSATCSISSGIKDCSTFHPPALTMPPYFPHAFGHAVHHAPDRR